MTDQPQCCGTCRHCIRGTFIYSNGCKLPDVLICAANLPATASQVVHIYDPHTTGRDCPCYAPKPQEPQGEN